MKLVKDDALALHRDTDVFGVDIGVLPCPPYFNQSIFLQAETERSPVTRAGVNDDSRVCPRDMRLNGKADTRAITDKWSEVKTQWF